jgi:predicted phosphodiesterase
MRYAIISDIHGNLEALQAVLQAAQQQNVQALLNIGDTLGYGASPMECFHLLKNINATSVAGNHDWAVAGRLDASYFPEDAKDAAMWTRSQISIEDITEIATLDLTFQNDDLMMVHASPYKPEMFIYITDEKKASQAFEHTTHPICFVGHTHVPAVYAKRGESVINTNTLEFQINPEYEYIINVGSVGQPRDGNPMASYCIYDSDIQIIELKRTQYYIQGAQQKIINAGLPESLALRLNKGQ